MTALSPNEFIFLYGICVLGALVLLAVLLFRQRAGGRLLLASRMLLLPAALSGALMLFCSDTTPPLGLAGFLFIAVTLGVVAVSCLLSLVCGAFCVRRDPRAAVWMVPAAAGLVFVAWPWLRELL